MKENKKKIGGKGLVLGLIALIVVCIIAVMVTVFLPGEQTTKPAVQTNKPVLTTPVQTQPQASSSAQQQTEPSQNGFAAQQGTINLGYGLEITDAGQYTGLYMEDGSNEVLSDVMMIVVYNGGDSDVQLAEITAVSGGEEYHFTLTNLAVGTRVVLLDTDRKASSDGALSSAVLDTVAMFQEPMDLAEDVIEVGGLDGMVNVRNISDADITGTVYVYYKYASEDVYYGGITFRVAVEGGLAAGEIRQIPAGHYTPDGCEIVQVSIYE